MHKLYLQCEELQDFLYIVYIICILYYICYVYLRVVCCVNFVKKPKFNSRQDKSKTQEQCLGQGLIKTLTMCTFTIILPSNTETFQTSFA